MILRSQSATEPDQKILITLIHCKIEKEIINTIQLISSIVVLNRYRSAISNEVTVRTTLTNEVRMYKEGKKGPNWSYVSDIINDEQLSSSTSINEVSVILYFIIIITIEQLQEESGNGGHRLRRERRVRCSNCLSFGHEEANCPSELSSSGGPRTRQNPVPINTVESDHHEPAPNMATPEDTEDEKVEDGNINCKYVI